MNFVKYNASLINILKTLIFPLHLSSLGGGVKWIKRDTKKKKKKKYNANFVKYNVSLSNILKKLIFSLTLSSLGSGVK